MDRISFDELYMQIVDLIKERSTCLRRKTAALLVKNNVILSSGYNGSPKDMSHCKECIRKINKIPSGTRLEYCRAIHAEQNAILQCCIKQTNPEGATLYCVASPCVTCAKLLIQLGIKRIVFKHAYPDDLAFTMLAEAEIDYKQYMGEIK